MYWFFEVEPQQQEHDQPGNQNRAFEKAEIEAAVMVDRLANKKSVAGQGKNANQGGNGNIALNPALKCRACSAVPTL